MYMAIFIRNWKQRALKDILRNIRNYSIFTHTKHVMSLKKKNELSTVTCTAAIRLLKKKTEGVILR